VARVGKVGYEERARGMGFKNIKDFNMAFLGKQG